MELKIELKLGDILPKPKGYTEEKSEATGGLAESVKPNKEVYKIVEMMTYGTSIQDLLNRGVDEDLINEAMRIRRERGDR